jgi:transcriptional regulator with XRE-family HTH domain
MMVASGQSGAVKSIGTNCHNALIALLIHEREKRKLRQRDVATRLGEYQSLIGKIESGQRRIDVCEFLKIAKAIGFKPGPAISKLFNEAPPD